MKRALSIVFHSWRFYVVISIIAFFISILICRVVYLTLVKQSFLRSEGNARTVRVVDIPAFRGLIVDRNGHPLAVSAEVYSAWVNPQEFSPSPYQLRLFNRYFNLNPAKLCATLAREKKRGKEFFYLKRSIDPEVAERLKQMSMLGFYLQREFKRFYPEGEMLAQILGVTNIDDRGQEGIELAFNDWLQGVPGKKVVLRDRLGHVVQELKLVADQKPGHHLILSIDRRIQYVAYRELRAAVALNKAKSATAVVLDAQTGEVLAMANYPSFNPNHKRDSKENLYRNAAVTDLIEPASTMKSFSAVCALNSGKFSANTEIDTHPGWLRVGHNVVRDDRNFGVLSLAQVLQFSSDVGTTKMILAVPGSSLWEVLHRVGFGEPTGIEFPGEQSGVLINRPVWSPFVLATLAFGYGMSVTPTQLARAYAVLANGGVRLPVTLLRRETPVVGEAVLNPQVAKLMVSLLESVVAKGTGAWAQVPDYRVAGKTGTAYMVGPHGYQKNHFVSAFVGMAPASRPLLVIAVIVRDPQGKYHSGGKVSGPIFSKIMAGTLRIMNVEPDALNSPTT